MTISNSSMPRTRAALLKNQANDSTYIGELVSNAGESGNQPVIEISPVQPQTATGTIGAPKKKNQFQFKLVWLFILLVILVIVSPFIIMIVQGQRLDWLVAIPQSAQATGDWTVILAPLVAVSLAIERFLETIFNWAEQTDSAVANLLSKPKDQLDWIELEYVNAYFAAKKAAEAAGVDAPEGTLEALTKAVARLSEAEQRVRSWLDSPEYKARKRAESITVGLLVGLLVVELSDMGLLRTIGIPTPRIIDTLITGLLIGAGPGPMHDFIGILQSLKDTATNLAGWLKNKAEQPVSKTS